MPTIYTIGHSLHGLEQFMALLAPHAIECVVDVRSTPYSRHAPRFNKPELSAFLAGRRVAYLFMGDLVGGKPAVPNLLDAAGKPCYVRIARSTGFRLGIERLLRGLAQGRSIALLCAEEDPARCHRHLLIARHLEEARVTVLHLRGDGSVLPAAILLAAPRQTTLF